MKSFRFQFIDQDESYTLSTTISPIKGFMVVRAPKGTADATYFEYGNEKAINAMIGLPTANWPDLYEAVAFNTSYGLYISAPAGTRKDYPSYYGGVYLTTKGLFNYWRVGDVENPNFEIQLYPGHESTEYDESYTDTEEAIAKINNKAGNSGVIQFTRISAELLQRVSYFTMKCWEDLGTGIKDGQEVQYHLVNGKIKAVVNDVDSEIDVGFYELTSDGTYTLTLGAIKVDEFGEFTLASNTSVTKGIPYLDFTKLFNYAELAKEDDLSEVTYGEEAPETKGEELIKDLLLNGTSSKFKLYADAEKSKEIVVSPFEGILSRIYWNVNVKSDCFLRISQKSPNETPTSITISNIGYDKYMYDYNVRYVMKKEFETIKTAGSKIVKEDGYEDFIKQLFASNASGIIDVITDDDELNWAEPMSQTEHSLWQYNVTTGLWTDITPDLKTKRFFIEGALLNSRGIAYSDSEIVKANCDYSIWSIVETGDAGGYNHITFKNKLDGEYQLKSNIDYNTVTISCKEEVYPGSYTSGGEFTGSLSEVGVDASGKKIYWPFVLPEDSVSFIRVDPVHTFEELGAMNEEGFFTEDKIVDPIGPAIDTYTFTVKGQRTCKRINDENIKAGTLGCTWVDDYEPIIREGLLEAQGQEYDDAYIFMEVTGQETFKPLLMALRQTYQQLSTVISPKMISKAEFLNPDTIVVSGRSTGTAQYVGEFKMYDSYTGKYYWCQPIGDVGAMLARIIEKRLGGIAPAGTNDTQGLGGVLPRPVLAARWNFKDSALEKLENKALNPITYDSDYGLMIQGQRTTQDPDNKTDWSYLGHSMSFDLCKREIRDTVMTQQVHKRVNDYWFDIRERQVRAILDKRLAGKDPIWASAEVDIAGVNTPATMAQRKFMITVKVKVYVYSDYVVLTFVNLPQE